MNSRPHVHALNITEYERFWGITYGDQTKNVDKPYFRNPERVLRQAVESVIAKHDRESLAAGDREQQRESERKIAADIQSSISKTLAAGVQTCPESGVSVYRHRFCDTCGGTGTVTKVWASELMRSD